MSSRPFLDISIQGDWTYVVVLRRDMTRETVSQAVRVELLRLVQEEGRHRLVLDLSNLEFIGDSFFQVILILYRRLLAVDGHLVLTRLQPQVAEVVQLVRLDRFFDIRQERPDAIISPPDPQEQSFLQAIQEVPDDDTPRLIFADWLEENTGQFERAELIRVQCELTRSYLPPSRREPLEAREQSLLKLHARKWARPVARLVSQWVFRRGFIEEITLHARAFLYHAREIFALAPVQGVHFVGLPLPHDLSQCPELGRVRQIDLRGCPVVESLALALLNSAHLNCATLFLSGSRLQEDTRQLLRERFGERLAME